MIALLSHIHGKGLRMNWDQIENQWAAMTRRIRADWQVSPMTPRANAGQSGKTSAIIQALPDPLPPQSIADDDSPRTAS